jgi:hypothetical protein
MNRAIANQETSYQQNTLCRIIKSRSISEDSTLPFSQLLSHTRNWIHLCNLGVHIGIKIDKIFCQGGHLIDIEMAVIDNIVILKAMFAMSH